MHPFPISHKTGKVLNIILLALILIWIRVWYLAVIKHDTVLQQAYKPQRKIEIEPVERAPIFDRFGIPLAINKTQYNAAVCYADIREIPAVVWQENAEGKKIKVHVRLEYIKTLSEKLGDELNMDPGAIEDLIHGRASLFPHTPYVVKEDLTEQQYYRLRLLEKDYLGIKAQRSVKRLYPQGKLGCDVIGYLGSISAQEYQAISDEMHELQHYLGLREQGENPFLPKGFHDPIQVRERLQELQEKSYAINDLVGKGGVEGYYDEELRGFHGKKIYEIDAKGNLIRELPGSKNPISGRSLQLTLSAQLQSYAEQLLAANEGPKNNSASSNLDKRWIKGGAVVALLPQTGEVVALASYPRFDPNDFVPTLNKSEKRVKEAAVLRWLENNRYPGEIWDGKRNLEREYFSFTQGRYSEEKLPLSWQLYLDACLTKGSEARRVMDTISTVGLALEVQQLGIYHPLLKGIHLEQDRLLILDLVSLAARCELFDPELVDDIRMLSLSDYHRIRQSAVSLQSHLKNEIQELFHDLDFSKWRKDHFKEYLKKKRKEEREEKKYPRPYTEYLDLAEKTLFKTFWDTYKLTFLYASATESSPVSLEMYPHLVPYLALIRRESSDFSLKAILKQLPTRQALNFLHTLRSFEDLTQPLMGKYSQIRKSGSSKIQIEKDLAAAFYPVSGFGYGRSQAFRVASAPGSVFKLVTAYEALLERYQKNKYQDLNPLTIIDDLKGGKQTSSPQQILGYSLSGEPIRRNYKGGLLPRSSRSLMGRLDLIGALEQSSNLYFAMLAGDSLDDPDNLAHAAKQFGFGEKTGIDLVGEAAGHLPDDLAHNKTGLYSFSIGQHSLEATPLQTAGMVSTIANHGSYVKPRIVKKLSGLAPLRLEDDLFAAAQFPFQASLALAGIDFPLFTAAQTNLTEKADWETPVEVVRSLIFPPEISQILTEGMRKSVMGSRGTARVAVMRNLFEHPTALRDYQELHSDIIAKTGTSQLKFKERIDAQTPAEMQSYVWFAAISYPEEKRYAQDRFDHPELVVVVFLRYEAAGRDAGTISTQIVKKWREILCQVPAQNK